MKYVSTKKNIVCRYGTNQIVEVGYGGLQHLLRFESPEAYTSGVYGWNADIYGFDGLAICTGYRPFGGVKASYEICQKYENLSRDLDKRMWEEGRSWDAIKKAAHDLVIQFLEEVFA